MSAARESGQTPDDALREPTQTIDPGRGPDRVRAPLRRATAPGWLRQRRRRTLVIAAATVAVLAAGLTIGLVLGRSANSWKPSVDSVLVWGQNQNGQLGNGATGQLISPTPSTIPRGTRQLVSGRDFELDLTRSGALYGWGANARGQLAGQRQTTIVTPVRLTSPARTVVSIDAGDDNSYAVASDGALYAWGDNGSGALGIGSVSPPMSATPRRVKVKDRVTSVSAAADHALALTSSHRVWAWGAGGSGQLGTGNIASSATPVHVALPANASARQIAAGAVFSLALTESGKVYSWGAGPGATRTGSRRPHLVPLPPGHVSAIAAERATGLAIMNDGSVYAWGEGSDGQLGNGTRTDSATPVKVRLPGKAEHVEAGDQHALALVDGRAYLWGAGLVSTNGRVSGATGAPVSASALEGGPTPQQVHLRTAVRIRAMYAGSHQDTVLVDQGAPARLVLTPPTASVPVGTRVTIAATAYDSHDTDLGNAERGASFTISSGTCQRNVCTPSRSGPATVTARLETAHSTTVVTATGAPTDRRTPAGSGSARPRPTAPRTVSGSPGPRVTFTPVRRPAATASTHP